MLKAGLPLAVTLRKRRAPTPPPKTCTKADESRRALANVSSSLSTPHPSTAVYNFTSAARGKQTEIFTNLLASPALQVTPKPSPAMAESLATRKARKAALTRWHPGSQMALLGPPATALVGEAAKLVPA
eukprot:37201-Prymnesium_polylepis.1